MKVNSGLVLLFLLSCSAFAAAPITAPLQPTTGPGGSDILYTAVQHGIYTVKDHTAGTGYDYYLYTPAGITPGPTNPNPLPTPASAPIILFIHGYDGNTPQPYLVWMAQMAQMGFIVIWPEYDSVANPGLVSYLTAIGLTFNAAITELNTLGGVQPMLGSDDKPIYTVAGHSLGGDLAVGVAAGYQTKYINMPRPAAVFAIESGQGTFGRAVLAGNMNASTMVIFVDGDEDGAAQGTADHMCDNVQFWLDAPQAPLFKQFLLGVTDTLGTPQQLMNHWFPLTYTLKDDVRPYSVDDRDYNITWKLSIAVSNCAVYGTQCDYVFGNGPENSFGETTQVDMGLWSNGTPVTPLLPIADPPTYFAAPPYNCVVKTH
jgi:acetyl esterase/lipase